MKALSLLTSAALLGVGCTHVTQVIEKPLPQCDVVLDEVVTKLKKGFALLDEKRTNYFDYWMFARRSAENEQDIYAVQIVATRGPAPSGRFFHQGSNWNVAPTPYCQKLGEAYRIYQRITPNMKIKI